MDKHTKQRARKQYQCYGCEENIEPGKLYWKRTTMGEPWNDGECLVERYHEPCYEKMQDVWSDLRDGDFYSEGILLEYWTPEELGRCAKAAKEPK